MRIVHIASEIAKVAKVGGLGDVVLGLSRELCRKGHHTEVILPKYSVLDYGATKDLHLVMPDLMVLFDGEWHHNSVWACYVEGVKVFLIEPSTAPELFNRERIYGYDDDIKRFTYFARASLEFMQKAEIDPDVIHLHEWHTAAAAPLLWEEYDLHAGVVFTIHNLQYQGECTPKDLERINLAGKPLNLLENGIKYADTITTVSPTYAEEIITPEEGQGLHKILQASNLIGIRNGLDYSLWGPEVDPYLPVPFSVVDLDDKRAVKLELQSRLALAQEDKPLISSITRLVPQKGVHLIKEAIFRTLELGGQFVLLGSSSIPEIQDEFNALKIHFADHPDVHLELQHNEELVHLIYGGSDMFVVPSIFEPCGLTQLIALRYGTVPIVRRTGGLADTIFDVDHSDAPMVNGFTFDEPENEAINSALDRAVAYWRGNPERWREIMMSGMTMDYSWDLPADAYLEVYQDARDHRHDLIVHASLR